MHLQLLLTRCTWDYFVQASEKSSSSLLLRVKTILLLIAGQNARYWCSEGVTQMVAPPITNTKPNRIEYLDGFADVIEWLDTKSRYYFSNSFESFHWIICTVCRLPSTEDSTTFYFIQPYCTKFLPSLIRIALHAAAPRSVSVWHCRETLKDQVGTLYRNSRYGSGDNYSYSDLTFDLLRKSKT
jgi:hypothetical protein